MMNGNDFLFTANDNHASPELKELREKLAQQCMKEGLAALEKCKTSLDVLYEISVHMNMLAMLTILLPPMYHKEGKSMESCERTVLGIPDALLALIDQNMASYNDFMQRKYQRQNTTPQTPPGATPPGGQNSPEKGE